MYKDIWTSEREWLEVFQESFIYTRVFVLLVLSVRSQIFLLFSNIYFLLLEN